MSDQNNVSDSYRFLSPIIQRITVIAEMPARLHRSRVGRSSILVPSVSWVRLTPQNLAIPDRMRFKQKPEASERPTGLCNSDESYGRGRCRGWPTSTRPEKFASADLQI